MRVSVSRAQVTRAQYLPTTLILTFECRWILMSVDLRKPIIVSLKLHSLLTTHG